MLRTDCNEFDYIICNYVKKYSCFRHYISK